MLGVKSKREPIVGKFAEKLREEIRIALEERKGNFKEEDS